MHLEVLFNLYAIRIDLFVVRFFLMMVTNFEINFFYMSWSKICHTYYHGVSEGSTLIPPQKQPLWILFLSSTLFKN